MFYKKKFTWKNNKNIPGMSVYDASEFRDEHEFSGFDDVQEVHDLQFSLKKKGVSGIEPMKFAGIMHPEEAGCILKTVEQDCRKIDLDEW